MRKLIAIVAMGMVDMAASAAGDNISFGDADVNHDGAITRQEAAVFAALEQAFDATDENGNGLIEWTEYVRLQRAENGTGK